MFGDNVRFVPATQLRTDTVTLGEVPSEYCTRSRKVSSTTLARANQPDVGRRRFRTDPVHRASGAA